MGITWAAILLWLLVVFGQWGVLKMWKGIPHLPPWGGGLPGTQFPSGQPSLQDLLFGVPFCSPVPCGLGWGSVTALLCYQSGVLWFHSSLLTPLQMAPSLTSELSHVSMLPSHWEPVGPRTTPTHSSAVVSSPAGLSKASLVLPLGSGKWQTHWVLCNYQPTLLLC